MPARPSRLSLLCALLAAACSKGPAPHYNTVLHLDPRFLNGASSARVLAATRAAVATFSLDESVAAADGDAHWRLVNGALERAFANGGIRVEPTGQQAGQKSAGGKNHPLGLVHTGPLDATAFNVVEADVRLSRDASARLCWRLAPEPDATVHEAVVAVEDERGAQVLRFALGRHPAWQGTIYDLCLEPSCELKQSIDLHTIRFLRQGFEPGFEPLSALSSIGSASPGEKAIAPEGHGDGGIVVHQYDGVRSWPTDLGVPLFARATVPNDGLLVVEVAATGPEDASAKVEFRVDGRAGGGDWELFARGQRGSGSGFGVLTADLGDFAGAELELRFAAVDPRDDEPIDVIRAPIETRALFGAPRILGREPRPPRPNVVLVTLDTLRADSVLDPDETPNLCKLAREGLVFEQAWSACNATTPSHATILTGLFITEHGATSNSTRLPDEVTTLAESYRAAGYETAAAVSVAHIQAGVGFGQGFDRFRQAPPEAYNDGELTLDAARRWIEEWGEVGERPFFLWIHLFDPHGPYPPPADFLVRYKRKSRRDEPPAEVDPPTVPIFPAGEVPGDLEWLGDITNHEHVRYLYGAGVAYTDELVGRLLEELEDAGLRENTALVITADHGEALGEHSVYYGHAGLFPETLRVPLILDVPGGPKGVRIAEPVSTIDLAPTLLVLAGIPPRPDQRGVDLIAIGRAGRGDPQRRLWFHYTRENQVGLLDPDAHFVETLTDRARYVYARREEPDGSVLWSIEPTPKGTTFLWDPVNDPRREHDLSAAEPERVARYVAEVRAFAEGLRERQAIERALTADEEARLKALGYGGD